MARLLFLVAALSAVPILLHWALWRVRLPRRQTRAIVLILGAGDVLLLLGLRPLAELAAPDVPPPGAALHFLIALFLLAVLCAYIITYSALEADSPTLVMVDMLERAGERGLPKEEFEARLNDSLLVQPRLDDLLRDRMAELVDGRYTLTAKGRIMACGFNLFARVLGAELGG